jgi:hypothetical protein
MGGDSFGSEVPQWNIKPEKKTFKTITLLFNL